MLMLLAGTARADISPEKGVQLAGYPHCPRENEGIHDPLYASALYLKNGSDEFVLVTLDLLSIEKKIVAELRERIGKPILVTVTHTHSGPRTSEALASDFKEGIREDPKYLAFLREKLFEVVSNATKDTFEAELGTGIGRCGAESGIGGNRRGGKGLFDDTVNVLAVRERGGKVRAVLVNYSLHPTYLHAENRLVTADYPGAMRQYFHFAEPDALFLFAQGTSGDQSSRYFRTGQNFEECVRAGTTIACEADRVLKGITYSSNPNIWAKSVQFDDLPMKEFADAEKAYAEKLRAEAAFEAAKSADYITMRNAELAMFGAQNTYEFALRAKEGYRSPELPYEVQFAKLGDTLIVALQGETFVKYGLEIKAASPYEKTFVFGVSNGYAPGYLYTPEAGREGGYETGTSLFGLEAGEVLLQKIGEELKHV